MAKAAKSADALAMKISKKELAARKAAEAALQTGSALRERPETKKNAVAHAEFVRLNKLLSGIEKNDAIYEAVINRYCMMLAECVDLQDKREEVYRTASKLRDQLDLVGENCNIKDFNEAAKNIQLIYKTLVDIDKQIDSKRRMLLAIEKENIMTMASALRSVPKKPETKESPLLKALSGSED